MIGRISDNPWLSYMDRDDILLEKNFCFESNDVTAAIHIGTSGWHYRHWRGPFYPRDIGGKGMFAFYAERFSSVEINNSFYRLPEVQPLNHWRDACRSDFVFAFKASRYLTHMKKLKTDADALSNLLKRVACLSPKLGPILFQLPPRWKVNPDRLKAFLDTLPDTYRYAFEFRDTTWHEPRIYDLLNRKNAAFCIYEFAGTRSAKQITADFIYVRLHGPGKEPYKGRYDPQTLAGWAGAFSAWQRQGKNIYCYFDNDENGYAALNALELQEMLR